MNNGRRSSPGRRPRRLKWAFRQLEHVCAIVGVVLLAYHFCFNLSVMTSGSMSPTLQGESVESGDWILTEKISYLLRRPRRWEVMTFRNRSGTQLMKRVVGLRGETVALTSKEKWVRIDGAGLARPPGLEFLEYYSYGNLNRGKSFRCDGGYFVLGDYSRDSADSRFEGVVVPERIAGRAWMIVWPFSRLGFVR